MDEETDRIIKRMREEQEIKCPFIDCNEIQNGDDGAYPMSYHGSEDGAEEWECQYCDKKFFVKENVRRTYDVAISEEDL